MIVKNISMTSPNPIRDIVLKETLSTAASKINENGVSKYAIGATRVTSS